MVGFDQQALPNKALVPCHVLSRAETGKGDEVTDHVRLIEVATLRRHVCPLDQSLATCQRQGVLKSSDSAKQFGPDTNFSAKKPDELPFAQPNVARDFAR